MIKSRRNKRKLITVSALSVIFAFAPLTVPAASVIYIPDYINQLIYSCEISSDGSFSPCKTSSVTSPTAVGVNQLGTRAFVVSNFTDTIASCAIKADWSLGDCANETTLPHGANGIALDKFGEYAYVGNEKGSAITYCHIDAKGGFAACQPTGAALDLPVHVALHPSGEYAYLVTLKTNDAYLSFCRRNKDGSLANCNATSPGMNSLRDIMFNAAGTLAYLANNDGFMTLCHVALDGNFKSCVSLGQDFPRISSMAMHPDNTFAYLATTSTSGTVITLCPIASDGKFGQCATANKLPIQAGHLYTYKR